MKTKLGVSTTETEKGQLRVKIAIECVWTQLKKNKKRFLQVYAIQTDDQCLYFHRDVDVITSRNSNII